MRTFTDGNLTVVAPDFVVWLQEKNLLFITGEAGHRVGVHYRSYVPTYTLDEEGKAVVDISELLRVAPLTTTTPFVFDYDGEQMLIEIYFTRGGLINPKNVLIPHDETLAKILAFDNAELALLQNELFIVPPAKMIMAPTNVQIAFELNSVLVAERDYDMFMSALVDGNWSAVRIQNACVLPRRAMRFILNEDYIGTNLIDRTLQPMECGKRYAAVRWVSFTGQTRCHTFEVVKANSNTIDSVELLTIDGSYNVVKGREDRFGLRLDNLTAYDFWYYSDVCHSSKVEVSMDGVEWQQVDVLTKTVSLPDGDAGKFNTLNVELKWRKYDAVIV